MANPLPQARHNPLPTARQLPRAEPPPLPGSRDLNRLGTGADYRSHRGAGLGDKPSDLQGAPLEAWVDVVSTWVYRSRFEAKYDRYGALTGTGDWFVEFLDGSLVVYHHTTNDVWSDFFNSSSKGQFIYYRCKVGGRPYETLRGPQRTVTAKHRFIRDVLPGTGRVRPLIGAR